MGPPQAAVAVTSSIFDDAVLLPDVQIDVFDPEPATYSRSVVTKKVVLPATSEAVPTPIGRDVPFSSSNSSSSSALVARSVAST